MSALEPLAFPTPVSLPGLAHGYTKLGHEVEDAQAAITRRAGAAAYCVLLRIIRHAIGARHATATEPLPLSVFTEETGLTRPTVTTALNALATYGLIAVTKGISPKAARTYTLRPVGDWRLADDASEDDGEDDGEEAEALRETTPDTAETTGLCKESLHSDSCKDSLQAPCKAALHGEASIGKDSLHASPSKEKTKEKHVRTRVRAPRATPSKPTPTAAPMPPVMGDTILDAALIALYALPGWRANERQERRLVEELCSEGVGTPAIVAPALLRYAVGQFDIWLDRKADDDAAGTPSGLPSGHTRRRRPDMGQFRNWLHAALPDMRLRYQREQAAASRARAAATTRVASRDEAARRDAEQEARDKALWRLTHPATPERPATTFAAHSTTTGTTQEKTQVTTGVQGRAMNERPAQPRAH